MRRDMDFKLLCPKCKKEPSQGNLLFILPWSARCMNAPYFTCSGCRVICVDKEKLRQYVRWWKELDFERRCLPSNKIIYKMALGKIENNIDYYVARIGYKRGRFIRKS